MENREVPQSVEPCVLHKSHSPVTLVNERHHPFPQAWQMELWDEIRDNRTVAVCATGHNNVHEAIRLFERDGKFPSWCIGKTRDLAEEAFSLRAEHN